MNKKLDKSKEVGIQIIKTPKRVVAKRKRHTKRPLTIADVLMTAVQIPDLPTANLEKIVELHERLERAEAKKAFDAAMCQFQGAIDVIVGTKEGSKTNAGELVFRYAPLEQIMPVIKPHLKAAGLSVKFKSELTEKIRKTTCVVTHVMGHSDSAFFESERSDGTRLMSNLQKESSTVSHQQRYALKLALNIVTEGEDDEAALSRKNGRSSDVALLTAAQVKTLEALIGSADESLYKAVTVEYKVESITQLPRAEFKAVKERIKEYNTKKKERDVLRSKVKNEQMEIVT